MRYLLWSIVNNVDRLRFAKRVLITGAVAMVTLAGVMEYIDRHNLLPPGPTFFNLSLLLLEAGAAVVTLTGYIFVSWQATPNRAMALGMGTIPAAILMFFISSVPFPAHISSFAIIMWVFFFYGTIAFVLGLLRLLAGLFRRS